MTEVDKIRRVITLYAQLLDSQRFGDWGALFTEDAEFTSIPGGHIGGAAGEAWSIRGRAEIVAQIGDVQRRQRAESGVLHFGGSPIIEIAGSEAEAWWDFIVLNTRPEAISVAHAGRYYAHFVKQDGRWCFTRRISVRSGTEWPASIRPTPAR